MNVSGLFDLAENITLKKFDEDKPIVPAVSWILDYFVDPITFRRITLKPFQKTILREALSTDKNGRNNYDLVVWSQPKKSGKTAIAGAVGAYVAQNIGAPNVVVTVANDQEQSAGRIFSAMMPTLENLGWTVPITYKSIKREPVAYGPNGTLVKAITTNFEKEAGENQGLSLWSELWAYKGERLNKLWDEMTPPPTRKYSQRWVETYAGYIGENLLLQSIYLKVFKNFEKEGEPVELQPNVFKLWPNLPCYVIDDHIFVFWDHLHRMDWQTPSYYSKQLDNLRKTAFIRLHGNYWVTSEDNFIDIDMWNNSVRTEVPAKPMQATYALDASKNNDNASLVGTIKKNKKIITTDLVVWKIEKGKELDFSKLENAVLDRWRKKLIKPPVYYDPYQLVKLAQDLRAKGVHCEEFPQADKRTRSDTFLYKLYKEGDIINPNNPDLKQAAISAKCKSLSDQRIRIIKPEKTESSVDADGDQNNRETIKVDPLVAQSMSAYMAYKRNTGGWAKTGKDMQ